MLCSSPLGGTRGHGLRAHTAHMKLALGAAGALDRVCAHQGRACAAAAEQAVSDNLTHLPPDQLLAPPPAPPPLQAKAEQDRIMGEQARQCSQICAALAASSSQAAEEGLEQGGVLAHAPSAAAPGHTPLGPQLVETQSLLPPGPGLTPLATVPQSWPPAAVVGAGAFEARPGVAQQLGGLAAVAIPGAAAAAEGDEAGDDDRMEEVPEEAEGRQGQMVAEEESAQQLVLEPSGAVPRQPAMGGDSDDAATAAAAGVASAEDGQQEGGDVEMGEAEEPRATPLAAAVAEAAVAAAVAAAATQPQEQPAAPGSGAASTPVQLEVAEAGAGAEAEHSGEGSQLAPAAGSAEHAALGAAQAARAGMAMVGTAPLEDEQEEGYEQEEKEGLEAAAEAAEGAVQAGSPDMLVQHAPGSAAVEDAAVGAENVEGGEETDAEDDGPALAGMVLGPKASLAAAAAGPLGSGQQQQQEGRAVEIIALLDDDAEEERQQEAEEEGWQTEETAGAEEGAGRETRPAAAGHENDASQGNTAGEDGGRGRCVALLNCWAGASIWASLRCLLRAPQGLPARLGCNGTGCSWMQLSEAPLPPRLLSATSASLLLPSRPCFPGAYGMNPSLLLSHAVPAVQVGAPRMPPLCARSARGRWCPRVSRSRTAAPTPRPGDSTACSGSSCVRAQPLHGPLPAAGMPRSSRSRHEVATISECRPTQKQVARLPQMVAAAQRGQHTWSFPQPGALMRRQGRQGRRLESHAQVVLDAEAKGAPERLHHPLVQAAGPLQQVGSHQLRGGGRHGQPAALVAGSHQQALHPGHRAHAGGPRLRGGRRRRHGRMRAPCGRRAARRAVCQAGQQQARSASMEQESQPGSEPLPAYR